ncbi:MAG: FliO/MopB family protein [Alphaproteobacteria bacterium]|nr:FliO/MopB family protein [Alphaproteobacteria bacterium]
MSAVDYLRFAAALLLVVGLILATAWALRRFGAGLGIAQARQGRRLGVVESLQIDARHRLLLVRRDGREHLLLLGAGGALLIEKDAGRDVPASASQDGTHA